MTHPVVDIFILKFISLQGTGTLWMICFILDDCFISKVLVKITIIVHLLQKLKIIAKIIPALNYFYFVIFGKKRVGGVRKTTK